MVARLLWEQDAAGSSPVTSTKTQKRRFASSSVFSSEFTDEEPLLFARKGSFCATLNNKNIAIFRAKKGSESCHSDQIWLWKAISEAFFFAYCIANFEG